MKLRPDARVIVKRAHPNGNLIAVRPVAAEKARTAILAKRLHGSLPFAINPDQLSALDQLEAFLQDARLRADGRPGMFPATIAMAMAGSQKGLIHFEAHSPAETAASNFPAHSGREPGASGLPKLRDGTITFLSSPQPRQ